MLFFDDIWHIVVRIVATLLTNPPGLPTWATWFLLVIRTVVVVVLFRRNIAPFMLARVSKRIRARSISPRSIKGLYFQSHGRTWRVERIGWSFHPWAESRVSVKIEGLRLDIIDRRLTKLQHRKSLQHFPAAGNMAPSVAAFDPVALSLERTTIFNWIYAKTSSASIIFARFFVRCIPFLTQNMDFDIDSMVISFSAFPGVHTIIKGVSLNTKIEFSHLEKGIRNFGHDVRTDGQYTSRSPPWKLFSGADGFWDRLWGQTQAFVSVNVTFDGVAVHSPSGVGIYPQNQSSLSFAEHTLETHTITNLPLPSESIIYIASPLRFLASAHVTPKLLSVQDRSVNCSLDIPSVNMSANGIRSLMSLNKSRKDEEMEQLMTPLESAGSWASLVAPRDIMSASSPVSPTSPFLTAFSHFTRHVRRNTVSSPVPPVWRVKDKDGKVSVDPSSLFLYLTRGKQAFVSLLKSIQLRISSITVAHGSAMYSDAHDRMKYIANFNGFRMTLAPSDPRMSAIHRKWLGSGEYSTSRESTVNLSCSFDAATITRISSEGMESATHLLDLHKLDVDLLLHNWPPWIQTSRLFPGNPNNSFVACETYIMKVDIHERLEDLCAIMKAMPAPASNLSQPSSPSLITCVPQVEFSMCCGDIQVRLACVDVDHPSVISALDVHTAGFNIRLSTNYHNTDSVAYREVDPISQQDAISLDSTCHLSTSPIVACVRQTGIGWERLTPGPKVEPFDSEPLLGLDAVEIIATAHTLGHLGHGDVAVLQLRTTILDLKCLTEGISVDLWKLECIRLVQTLSTAFGGLSNSRNASHSNQFGFFLGVSLHIGVECFTGIATARDINPNCDLELSRGLAFRTGFSLQYSYIKSYDPLRLRHLISEARQQLGLPEDHFGQSIVTAQAKTGFGGVSSFIQGTMWNTTCRTATSTRYAVDDSHTMNYDGTSSDEILRQGILMSVPRTSMRVRLQPTRLDISSRLPNLGQTCDITIELSHLMVRFDLFNVYSALLALHTLQSLTPPTRPHPQRAGSVPNLSTSLNIRTENAHVFFQFPLQEQMFMRMLSLSLERKTDGILKAHCQSVVAWVPSVQCVGKWEELSRIRDLSIGLNSVSNTNISVAADGLRIVIPHQYALSELVLNIGLTIKALRHLRRTVEHELYILMNSPIAEPPKKVPKINLRIHSLTLEAADSSFEAKLGLIWRAGFQAQKVRAERELAFEAKLRAILASGDPEITGEATSNPDLHYHFTPKRTTSITDARNRLNMVHSNSWLSAISRQKEEIVRKEEFILRQLRYVIHKVGMQVPIPIAIQNSENVPPLFRAVLNDLKLSVSAPDLPDGHEGFLSEFGNMPRLTEYSLLLPLYLELTLGAATINIRDYHLPLLNIPISVERPSLEFITTFVIAEEMGDARSVEWHDCPIFQNNTGIFGAKAFHVCVPKTIMPVKSYATPEVHFRTPDITDFTWGVSYNPAMQEVMRVVETLSQPPHDPSPSIGFWDKLRLVFHWRINASFEGGVRLHFKGSRDPYHVVGIGAGFDFCWDGNVSIKVGFANNERELIQLTSDSMIVTIPDHQDMQDGTAIGDLVQPNLEDKTHNTWSWARRSDRKICAKFDNGIRWGVGIILERTCDDSCGICHGDTFSRECRFFTFIPHHQVILRTAGSNPEANNHDSYAGFRSNFIHFSTSLVSPLSHGVHPKDNSFHLTPKIFAHFWSWWHLFDGALSLPIRQGPLFPRSRPPSKKFTRHLATLKYRISFSPLYITHVYKMDSGDAWSSGESHCVGVKAFVKHFQADLHQREEETSNVTKYGVGSKIIRHKAFSAVEVVIRELDLNALFAVFSEPQKKSILLKDTLPGTTNFWSELTPTPLSSSWVNPDDFVELDWSPSDLNPNIYLHEVGSCPRFVYFKRIPKTDSGERGENVIQTKRKTKFGDEASHFCLMGREPTAQEVQLEFGYIRLAQLRSRLAESIRVDVSNNHEEPGTESTSNSSSMNTSNMAGETSVIQMIALLERYTQHLSQTSSASSGTGEGGRGRDIYDMPTDIQLPQVGEFINVYQVHCPKISLSNATRNILQQYYLASTARRGFEYHMSTRAVKFIRDQAHSIQPLSDGMQGAEQRQRSTIAGAQAAAQAFRRIITGEERSQSDTTPQTGRQKSHSFSNTDPLFGWDKTVSERKAHFCLLLKPQIILRSESSESSSRSVLVLAADHVVLRNHGILDTINADDPVSGNVMQRNYADINGLQLFEPVAGSSSDHLPLEIFVDFRCESRDFSRLVPQTHAILRYDKFNRLRLRNNVTRVSISPQDGDFDMVDHLLHETDLIAIQVPRFSVSANAAAFSSMHDIVTKLLLFRDPVHKARVKKLETMLFSYNFNDLESAAGVVANLQSRIRQLMRIEGALNSKALNDAGHHDLLSNKAHILTLSQELNLIFDAIKLSQDKTDERNQDKKSALCLQASSSDISWQMIDDNRELLAKLAVRGIDYSWLSREDSSSANKMDIRDLQVFDGSPTALWPEILAKYDDPPTHQMIRRGIFAEIQWSVLAPVGGIPIYDRFEVELHPIRLALETHLGNKLLDYFIPSRRMRREAPPELISTPETPEDISTEDHKTHVDHYLTVHPPTHAGPLMHHARGRKAQPIPSRSVSNLRSAAVESEALEYHAPGIPKSRSSTALVPQKQTLESSSRKEYAQSDDVLSGKAEGDASEMRQRSAQKTFVYVRVPSVHVHLNVMRGRTFLVRDARLRTHDLEWRNRTWSFDELVSQFVPSDPSWRGWVKVAWQQHVFSVGGVVKELITKTQWGKMGKSTETESDHWLQGTSKRDNDVSSEDVTSEAFSKPGDSSTSLGDPEDGSVEEGSSLLTPRPRTISKTRVGFFRRREEG